ncbi:MAG: enoyl-CoA hydratase [Candidatus Puniceispirillaceae bacterium]|jgi:enoyl-CoA hydratase/carnithine racemase
MAPDETLGIKAGSLGSLNEHLREEHKGDVAVLTLNRPDARNCLSLEMISAITVAIERLAETPAIKVIILTAAGPVFCAGHDLKQMTAARADGDRGRAYFTTTLTACSTMMQAIIKCPKPVIAAVQGTATAAGCQLVATCDLAVTADTAKFATPGVHIGLFCSTPMVAISRNVGRKHAMEMLLTGEAISADKALEFGLVNKVVAPDALLEAAHEMADLIASKPISTVKIGKEAFYRQLEMPLSDAYDYAAHTMVENMLNRDAEEGIGAFLEKRDPKWEEPS